MARRGRNALYRGMRYGHWRLEEGVRRMTWSIVARDHDTGFLGVLVTTCDLGVGGICPMTRAGVGAISSQALPNPTWRQRGLELINQGISPQDAVDALVHADQGSAHRQLHLV